MEEITPPADFSSRLVARQQLAPGVIEVRFDRPAGFSFLPGQFVRFSGAVGERDYTLVSAPNDETIDLCIGVVAGGRFSHIIDAAAIGSAFRFSGPHGHFVYHPAAGRQAVFVATGTGVAPFVAFCRGGGAEALLLHGVRAPADLLYPELLRSRLQYTPCISRPFDPTGALTAAFAGRVTDYLKTNLPPGTYDFYLCGRRAMIRDATALIDQHFDGPRIFIESYD